MVGIVFSTVTSIIPRLSDSYTIKAAYLLSDRVLALGASGVLIEMKGDTNKYTLQQKINKLEIATLKDKNDAGYNYVLDVKHAVKQFSLIKHRTKEQIVANANMERNFQKYYDGCNEGHKFFLMSLGFGDMRTLLEKDILDSYPLELNVKEVLEDNSPNLKLAASLTKLLYPSGNPDDALILFVTMDFLDDYNELMPEVTKIEDITTEQQELLDNNVKLWSCLKIDNLDCLSALELKLLRGQVMKEGTAFKKNVHDYIRMNAENAKSTAELDLYFDDVFFPEAERLQTRMEESEIMRFKNSNVVKGALRFELTIGEASLDYYFTYLEKFNIVDLPTLNFVRDEIKLHKDYPRFVPFICVSTLFTNMDEMEAVFAKEIEEDELPKLRKFISIDD